MTIDELGGEFDCAQYTADVAAIANVLWADAGLPMVLLGAERTLLAFNAAAMPSLSDEGVRRGGMLTESMRHAWLDDEVEECPQERMPLARAYTGETVHRQVIRINTASFQEQSRMRVTALPVTLHDGTSGVLLSWQDITEQWLTERRDRREIRRLDQLLEGASDYAIVVLDLGGRVQTWSRSAERLHGHPMEKGVGLAFADLFPEPARKAGVPEQILGEAADTGSARSENLRLRRDGSTYWAEGAVSVLRDEAGVVSGFVEVAHDVSQKRAAEQEILLLNTQLRTLNQELEHRIAERTELLVRQTADLKSANAELESFSYSVSHNLRAPLRAIGGYARLIEERHGEDLPAEAIGYLNKLYRNAVTMGQLIDGLLELSRTQRVSLAVEELDMVALVWECWEALAEDRGDRKIELTVGELPSAEGDRRLIYQVWMNLLENAIKYTSTRSEGRISVSAGMHNNVTRYRVEDNGVGFEMKYAHKIGQVFQPLHDGSQFAGTGLGMASVQRIVLRHGGTVIAHGEPDVGATMEFSLWAKA